MPLGLIRAGFTLFLFAAGLWARARQEESRWWAGVVLGAATIAALFAIVDITEIVLTAKAAQLASSPAVVQALWTLRAAAFGLDMAAVRVALIGLSRAAVAMRLIPSWLALTAWPGAACLLTASVFTVALADGGPWLALGIAGSSSGSSSSSPPASHYCEGGRSREGRGHARWAHAWPSWSALSASWGRWARWSRPQRRPSRARSSTAPCSASPGSWPSW